MPPRGSRYRHHDDKMNMRHGKPHRYPRTAPESSGSDKSGSESSDGSQSDSEDSRSESDSEGRETRKSSKPAAVCVKNLPARPSDHSLEEALFHEFKRSGEIIYTRVVGSGEQRYAVVKFKKATDAEKAMVNNGKMFLGQEMKLVPFKLDENDDDHSSPGPRKSKSSKHFGNAIEELGYDPQATRTLFIGNLEKTLTHGELKKSFDKFGEIVDVDIKKQDRGVTTYAFIQYIDVGGAMRGKKSMDRQFVGRNRVKVGYGRGTPTNSIWIGNLGSNVTESHLQRQFNAFGSIAKCMIDREYLQALVWFETVDSATVAFTQTRGKFVHGKRLTVDFASRSCKEGFYIRMEQTGQLNIREMEPSPPAHPAFNPAGGRGGFNRRPSGYESRGGRSSVGGRYSSGGDREYSSGKGESYYNNEGSGSYHRTAQDDDCDDYERELRDYGYRQKEREREKVRKPDRDNSERGYSPLSDEDQHRQAMRAGRDSRSPMSGRGEDGGYLSDGEVRYDPRRSGMKRKRGTEDEVYGGSPSPVHVDSVVTKMDKLKRRKKERLAKKKSRSMGEAEAEFAGMGSNDEVDEELSQEKLAKLERLRKKKKLALERVEEKARRKELKRLKKLKRLKSSESGPPPDEKENESGEMIDDKEQITTEDPLHVDSQDEKYNPVDADTSEVFPIGKNDNETNEEESIPEKDITDKVPMSPLDTPASPSVDEEVSVKIRESLSPVLHDEDKSEIVTHDSEKEQSPERPHEPRTPTPSLDEDRHRDAASNEEEDDDDDDDDSDKEISYRRARRERGPATPPHYDDKETTNNRNRERRPTKDSYDGKKREEPGFRESREMRGPYNNRGSDYNREDWRERPSRDGPKRERMPDRYDNKSRDRDERPPARERMRFRRSSSPRNMDQRQRSPPARYRNNEDKRPRSPLGHKAVHSPDYPRGRESPDKGRYDKRRSRQGSPFIPERERQKGYGQHSQSGRIEGHDGRDRRDFNRRLDRSNMGREESPPPPPPPPPTKHDPSVGGATGMTDVHSHHHHQGQIIHPPSSGSTTMQYQMGNQPMPGGNAAPGSATSTAQTNPYTLLDLLRRYPVMWQGIFALKHNSAAIQMHFLSGNVRIAEASLPRCSQPGEVPPPLTISQRMKLEPSQLDGVNKRIQVPNDHCLLLALPCGRDPLDVHAQTRALKSGFISYLQEKQAAGIINVNSSATKQPAYVLHIFPPCDFAQSHLAKVAPDLLDSAADSGHLMVLVTTI